MRRDLKTSWLNGFALLDCKLLPGDLAQTTSWKTGCQD